MGEPPLLFDKPDGSVGITKPHFSLSRYRDGSPMWECRQWPKWPDSDGTIIAVGRDMPEAWGNFNEGDVETTSTPDTSWRIRNDERPHCQRDTVADRPGQP